MISICIVSLGAFLIYHFYQNKIPPVPTRGIFVMNVIEGPVVLQEENIEENEIELITNAFAGEFYGYLY